ncbi:tex261 protein [Anaeramoeba flamelloides]|uniref:Tex261 protein n=1 Tax=Anaeramoeba flamelloides TaxID=1746091 RepID=A0AAV7YC66_9EUKA|nr:tex261 protein [Anaeramoeba flamelloides]KAJ6245423.1 tex261 protein [Anaeramoeba flamelloides]
MWFFVVEIVFAITIIFLVFLSSSLSGIYYLSEVVLDYRPLFRKIIKIVIGIVITIATFLLIFEQMYLIMIPAICTHLVYLFLLRKEDVLRFISPEFLLSLLATVTSFVCWFVFVLLNDQYMLINLLSLFFLCGLTVPILLSITLDSEVLNDLATSIDQVAEFGTSKTNTLVRSNFQESRGNISNQSGLRRRTNRRSFDQLMRDPNPQSTKTKQAEKVITTFGTLMSPASIVIFIYSFFSKMVTKKQTSQNTRNIFK